MTKKRSEKGKYFLLLYEVAHFTLKHKDPVFHGITQEESYQQEIEADNLAEQWLGWRPRNDYSSYLASYYQQFT